jgi:hypothetical protein
MQAGDSKTKSGEAICGWMGEDENLDDGIYTGDAFYWVVDGVEEPVPHEVKERLYMHCTYGNRVKKSHFKTSTHP